MKIHQKFIHDFLRVIHKIVSRKCCTHTCHIQMDPLTYDKSYDDSIVVVQS